MTIWRVCLGGRGGKRGGLGGVLYALCTGLVDRVRLRARTALYAAHPRQASLHQVTQTRGSIGSIVSTGVSVHCYRRQPHTGQLRHSLAAFTRGYTDHFSDIVDV